MSQIFLSSWWKVKSWLHIAIDRFAGTIVAQQLEEVTE
jgi:hypothetical protein